MTARANERSDRRRRLEEWIHTGRPKNVSAECHQVGQVWDECPNSATEYGIDAR